MAEVIATPRGFQAQDAAGKTFMAKDAFQGLQNVPVKLAQNNTEPTI